MMKIVLLLALTVAVYSFPKERSLPSLLKSVSKRSISSFHKRSMFDIFDKYDTNHDNYLDGEEMADLFYVHGFPAHEAEIIGFYQVDMFDLDGDQLLSRWEFIRNEDSVKPVLFL